MKRTGPRTDPEVHHRGVVKKMTVPTNSDIEIATLQVLTVAEIIFIFDSTLLHIVVTCASRFLYAGYIVHTLTAQHSQLDMHVFSCSTAKVTFLHSFFVKAILKMIVLTCLSCYCNLRRLKNDYNHSLQKHA